MFRNICIVFLACSIVACAGGSTKPTVPDRKDARKACPVTEGIVLQVTDVTIERHAEAAQGVGAVLGGYAGHEVAGSNDLAKVFGAAAGAAVGSVAGDAVGKAALNRDGQELIVAINGASHSIIQETDSRATFNVGDKVWVIGDLSSNYRNRYIRNSNTNCQNGIRAIPKE